MKTDTGLVGMSTKPGKTADTQSTEPDKTIGKRKTSMVASPSQDETSFMIYLYPLVSKEGEEKYAIPNKRNLTTVKFILLKVV